MASLNVPVVDFTPWTSDDREAQHHVAAEVTEACRKYGCVYLTGTGLSDEAIADQFGWMRRFFGLEHEQKMLARHADGKYVFRGYMPAGQEKLKANSQAADTKESFDYGSETNLHHANVFAPDDTLPGFRSSQDKFFCDMWSVTKDVLRALAIGLGIPKENQDFFLKHHSGDNNLTRLAYYPPISSQILEVTKSPRLPPHVDFSSITLLLQDGEQGGLEVEDRETGLLTPVEPLRNAILISVGDVLQRWTNNQIKSCFHHVSIPQPGSKHEKLSADGRYRIVPGRYSIPYFVYPDGDSLIEVIPECTSEEQRALFEPMLMRDFFNMRLQQIGYHFGEKTVHADDEGVMDQVEGQVEMASREVTVTA